ncbi:MAG TPA: hypothetical protein VE871_16910, partial [Longimicrobium sp.]|nr:hypothetical protein [Longimicrobium sp.]
MKPHSPVSRRTRAALLLLSLLACLSPALSAQTGPGGCSETTPTCDSSPPSISILPGSGTVAGSPLQVTIQWSDETSLNLDGRTIALDGVNVRHLFTESGSGALITSTGTIPLVAGQPNQLVASISDLSGNSSTALAQYTFGSPGTGIHHGVTVLPDGRVVQPVSHGYRTQGFVVRNTGSQTATFRVLTPLCTGGAAIGCRASTDWLTLAPGAWRSVAVTYLSGAAGATGTITLRVEQTSPTPPSPVWDEGHAELRVIAAPTAKMVNEADTLALVERGLCLTISAGPGAAYECGDLRLAHTLPATAALGQTRAPTLLYNSQHAQPTSLVSAHVTLPVGHGATQVRATAWLDAGGSFTGSWSAWAGGQQRVTLALNSVSVGLPSGAYPYTLVVDTISPHGVGTVTQLRGTLMIVNRSASPFGAGWWLAGLEQLVPQGQDWYWMGGDGSARLYRSVGGGRWAADVLTRPDTLHSGGTGASLYYYRRLPGGVRVLFGASGLHLATLNGRDHRTDFGYSGSRLSTITLPRGSAAPVQQYTFRYNAATGLLESVTAPAAGQPRVVQLTRSGDTLRITGPDTTGVRFVRHPTAPNRIHRRVDRMGAVTEYGYGAGGLLTQVVRFGGGSVR